ncbi:MAG TPA: substrate-binding domain-containing protein [Kribbella sp.]|nr:substrate-binding domain-containing protein [Kribbella sp.]
MTRRGNRRTLEDSGPPDDVTLVAWDDSTLCRITHPRLTAMSHNVVGYGAEVTHRLLDLLNGAQPQARLYSTPLLIIRDSSGPPPPG